MVNHVLPVSESSEHEAYKTELKTRFEQALKLVVNSETPKSLQYQRKGRGNQTFTYMPVWWVIDQLNALFNYNWNWEIVREDVGKAQVWVLGMLTIQTEVGLIKKSSYGGADIKKLREGGEIVDIGDDLKAASADALKKAASMVGVAADLYRGAEVAEVSSVEPQVWKTLMARTVKLGWSEDEFRDWVKGENNKDLNPDGLEIEDMAKKDHATLMMRITQKANA